VLESWCSMDVVLVVRRMRRSINNTYRTPPQSGRTSDNSTGKYQELQTACPSPWVAVESSAHVKNRSRW